MFRHAGERFQGAIVHVLRMKPFPRRRWIFRGNPCGFPSVAPFKMVRSKVEISLQVRFVPSKQSGGFHA